jgi:hypothetical protein
MPKDVSKGEDNVFPGKQEKVNILLIGNYASDADVLRRELTIITSLSYTAWYCSDLEEALIFLANGEPAIALIFIDLSIFDGGSPRERFLHIRQKFPYTPIIALADRTSDLLVRYVMENGATDNISRSQIRCEPDRFRDILNKPIKTKGNNRLVAMQAANDHDNWSENVFSAPPGFPEAVNIKLLPDRGNLLLMSAAQKDYPPELCVSNIENAQLRNKLTPNENGAQKSRAMLLHQIAEQDAVILNMSGDNAKLRKDLHQRGVDLEEARLTGDAILKYAQDKGAIELKSARDEIKGLHDDLLQARECPLGGYPLFPQTKE